jgi:O-antigen/teichoic acid export membrane protein
MTAESGAVIPTHRSLVAGAAWMTLANGARLFFQAVYFIVLARTLGPSEYGRFAAGLALVSVLAPFAAMGMGNVMVMHVARGSRPFAEQWGRVLVAIPAFGCFLSVVVVALGHVVVPVVPVFLLAILCIAELGLSRLCDSAVQAFQAHEQARTMALLTVLPTASRAVAAVAAGLVLGQLTAVTWSELYLVATAIAALPAYVAVHIRFGPPRLRTPSLEDVSDGIAFSAAQSSASIYTDIDKALLARMASLADTGAYAAAYRATAFAFVPILSIFNAAYAHFFRAGKSGIRGAREFAQVLAVPLSAYGLLAATALILFAPLLSRILGPGFAESESAVRWLAMLPLLQGFAYLAGDVLTGGSMQGRRTIAQILTAGLNVILCVGLIPLLGWRGAAVATLASLLLLAVALWGLIPRHGGSRPHGLRIMAWPSRYGTTGNPYIRQLYDAVATADPSVQLGSWPPNVVSFVRADIWHIHWPERIVSSRHTATALVRTGAFVALAGVARLLGIRIVWTVHNLAPHQPTDRRVDEWLLNWLAQHVDGTIALSENARSAAVARYPTMKLKPSVIIPHGHYRVTNPSVDKLVARSTLRLEPDAIVAVLAGRIARYKNPATLLCAFRSVSSPLARLVIAGKPVEDGLEEEVRSLAAGDPRIRLDLRELSDSAMTTYICAADIVVLPFRQLLNSGTAMLALSCCRPILVPATGAMVDLADDFGHEWVRLFDGALTAEQLQNEFTTLRLRDVEQQRLADQLEARYSWADIGSRTVAFYREIVRP